MFEKSPRLIVGGEFTFSPAIVFSRPYKQFSSYGSQLSEYKRHYTFGANMREANLAISNKEFIAKAQIALKEASETEYWIKLLVRSTYLKQESDLLPKINEIIRILTAILKTSKENLNA